MLKIGQGKMTKSGVGLAALAPLVQNAVNVLQGEELQSVVDAANGAIGAIGVLIGAVVALWGSFRASINYGGDK